MHVSMASLVVSPVATYAPSYLHVLLRNCTLVYETCYMNGVSLPVPKHDLTAVPRY